MNDSRYQSDSLITSSNINQIKQAWFFPANHSVTSTPLVQDGSVYFADWGGNVYSLNIFTGAINWKTNVGFSISSTPALANGLVYVAGSPLVPTRVIALDQNNGAIAWNTTLPCLPVSHYCGIYSSPIYYNGMVYVGLSDCHESLGSYCTEIGDSNVGQVYALSATDGHPIWNFTTGNYTTDGGWGGGVWGSVVIDPTLNAIYFGTGNPFDTVPSGCISCMGYTYSILSLDASTGKLNWQYGPIFSNYNPAIDDDFGSTPNLFSVVDNGITHQVVGIANKNGNYYILDRKSGSLLEAFSKAGNNIGVAGFYYPSGTETNPVIFIPSRDRGVGLITAFRAGSDSALWTFSTPSGCGTNCNFYGSVALIPGAVLAGDNASNLWVLSMTDGSVLYHTQLVSSGYGIDGGVTVAEGYVLVGDFGDNESAKTNSGGLYAFTVPGLVTPTTYTTSTNTASSSNPSSSSSSSSQTTSSSTTSVPIFHSLTTTTTTRSPSSPGVAGLSTSSILIIGGVVAAIVIVSAALFARRRV
jgi:outer membrane protein assembly factor BamB